MPFDNQRILAHRRNKPHIQLFGGYWRVSPLPKRHRHTGAHSDRWKSAHEFARIRNEAREFGLFS